MIMLCGSQCRLFAGEIALLLSNVANYSMKALPEKPALYLWDGAARVVLPSVDIIGYL
jgi:hypothetical protein